MNADLTPTRDRAIAHTRLRLQRDSFPRLQMALIVALTGAAGFLASFTLLHAGVEGMAMRWPLALGVAYLGFLGLLGLWLRWQAQDGPDPVSLMDFMPSGRGSGGGASGGSGRGPAPVRSGGGGDFGGGGASASFDMPLPGPGAASVMEVHGVAPQALADGGSSPGIELPDLDVDLGDVADGESGLGLLGLLLVTLLALAVAAASAWVVWTAPALLAEVLVDGALSFTLYRHLRRSEPRHWLRTALRRTLLPFIITALCLAVMGGALSAVAPGARTIGEVVNGPAPR